MEEMSQSPDEKTLNYIFNQTMLRIKDPEKSSRFLYSYIRDDYPEKARFSRL